MPDAHKAVLPPSHGAAAAPRVFQPSKSNFMRDNAKFGSHFTRSPPLTHGSEGKPSSGGSQLPGKNSLSATPKSATVIKALYFTSSVADFGVAESESHQTTVFPQNHESMEVNE